MFYAAEVEVARALPAEPAALSSTSYALLGLLAVQPWTTYELARQMDRTLSRFWPRARSSLYEEPKKLVALGLAVAEPGATGRRPRTVYRITPAGRRSLARWLEQPGQGPVLEHEQLLKVFFAESGTTDDVRRQLAAARAWAAERHAVDVEVARSVLAGTAPFPARTAQNVVVGRFLGEFALLVDEWAAWAEGVVGDWPDDPAEAAPDLATVRRLLDRYERRAAGVPDAGTERPTL